MVKTGSAGVARRWGRLHCADGTSPPARDGVSGAAARHERPALYCDELQATHHGSEASRGTRGRRHTKQIEQRSGANGILVARRLLPSYAKGLRDAPPTRRGPVPIAQRLTLMISPTGDLGAFQGAGPLQVLITIKLLGFT